MEWWNSLTEAERAKALEAAGWKSGGTWTPSAADAWALHKNAIGAQGNIVIINGNGDQPYVFDTETNPPVQAAD
jgi:hypothetical protein